MKVYTIVIDGFGIGETPDAASYGDKGANTFGNIDKIKRVKIPNMEKLGMRNIEGVGTKLFKNPVGTFARVMPKSKGKDTLTGHLEMAGIITDVPFPTYHDGIPKSEIKKLEELVGTGFIGGQALSGTKIIEMLGQEHLNTLKPIIYTSADSVLQIAAHEDVLKIEKLYKLCEKIRKNTKVGRVIARPFSGDADNFFRLNNLRKDFGLEIKKETLLDKLYKNNVKVISVGKIYDIFNGRSINIKIDGKTNDQAIENLKSNVVNKDHNNTFIFVNLVDTDMVYGHRNDISGYKKSLEKTDNAIGYIMKKMSKDDVLIITADHGCDPTLSHSTDHTREYVPFLMYSKNKKSTDLKTINGIDIVKKKVLEMFNIN